MCPVPFPSRVPVAFVSRPGSPSGEQQERVEQEIGDEPPKTSAAPRAIVNFGPWTLDFGPWTLDLGLWTLDFGPWTLDLGLWTSEDAPLTLRVGGLTGSGRVCRANPRDWHDSY